MLANSPDAAPLRDSPATVDPFARIDCPALRTALREVSAEWGPRVAFGSEGDGSIDRVLLGLALRLDGLGEAEDSPGQTEREEQEDPRTQLRLLEAIRRDLIEQWRRGDLPVDEDRVMSLMHAVELQVEELHMLETEGLQARLAEPDAFALVAEVAHDLRSPLTSVLFLSEALRNGHSGSLTELQQRQLGLIYSAGLGLMGVVNDLMSVAQEQTSDTFEEALPFSIVHTFEAVEEMVAPMAEAKMISLQLSVHCAGLRLGHSGPLGRVLLNLTTNAVKFTPEGGTVEVRADSLGRDAVEISVRDTGRGFLPEHRNGLFRPFQKSTGRRGFFFSPSGLGLSIVRRLLGKMDSELRVQSEPGRGTTFSFELNLPTAE